MGQNYGPISAEFYLLLGKVTVAPCGPIGCPANFVRSTGNTAAAVCYNPFLPRPQFVNRGDTLGQVHKRCSEPAGCVALVDLGGVGKSQLAIEFAHRAAAEEPDRWVFWVHAAHKHASRKGSRRFAVKLPGRRQPKADVPQLVYSWLSNERNGRWTVVLDSADCNRPRTHSDKVDT